MSARSRTTNNMFGYFLSKYEKEDDKHQHPPALVNPPRPTRLDLINPPADGNMIGHGL